MLSRNARLSIPVLFSPCIALFLVLAAGITWAEPGVMPWWAEKAAATDEPVEAVEAVLGMGHRLDDDLGSAETQDPLLEPARAELPGTQPARAPATTERPELRDAAAPRAPAAPDPSPRPSAAPRRTARAAEPREDPALLIDFQDADLREVIQEFARLSRKRFVYDERVRGKVSIVSEEPADREQALRMFESILHMKGFTTVERPSGEFVIVPLAEAKRLPLAVLDSSATPPQRDVFTTKIIALQHVKVEAIKRTLLDLASSDANVVADVHSNSLIVTDTAAQIRRILEVVSAIDVPTFEGRIEVVSLTYANAAQLVDHLREVFGSDRPGAAADPKNPAPRFIPDEATNSMVVVAQPAVLSEVERVVALLDYRRADTSALNFYSVKNAHAQELAQTLSELVRGSAPPSGAKGASGVAPLAVQGAVKITADAPTNSLLIQAGPQDYAALLDVIRRLDVRQPQVLIEVLMLESQDGTGEVLGTHLLYKTLLGLGSRRSKPYSIASGGTPDAPAAALWTGAAPSPAAVDQALGGPFGSTLIGNTISLLNSDGQVHVMPMIGAVIEAARSDPSINIVSAPQILTADNAEARIVVGEKRGFPTSTRQAVSPLGASPFQTSTEIERQDVGVTMRVTPQITEGDSMRMRIFTELSDVTDPENPFGPTTSHREIENTVYVKDGQSVMIGGIMRDDLEKTERSVPLLGDVPWVGRAFRSTRSRAVKTNLLLLLTPRIVHDDTELAALTAEGRDRLRTAAPRAASARGDGPGGDPNPVRRELGNLEHRAPEGRSPEPGPRRAILHELLPAESTPAPPAPVESMRPGEPARAVEPSEPELPLGAQAPRKREPVRPTELRAAPEPEQKAAATEPVDPPQRRPLIPTGAGAGHRDFYQVQVQAIADAREAQALYGKLLDLGFPAELSVQESDGKLIHCIRIGPYASSTEARRVDRAVEKAARVKAMVMLGS